MANGYDIQTWKKCGEKTNDLGLKIEISGNKFYIEKHGVFEDIMNLFYYLCGYENGLGDGTTRTLKIVKGD